MTKEVLRCGVDSYSERLEAVVEGKGVILNESTSVSLLIHV